MFSGFFDSAVRVIELKRSLNESLSASLAPIKSFPSPNSAESIVVPVKKTVLSCSVAGVDSGFVSKRLSFLDFVLVKTAGVVFDYKSGVVLRSEYYPAPFSFPKPVLLSEGLERDEEQQSVSLIRLREEVDCAIEVIKKFKPKYLFIDGSIVPQYQDKPRKESSINEEYHSIIHKFEELYNAANNSSTVLIACVEDSRGSRFAQILKDEIIPKAKVASVRAISADKLVKSFDASLLDYYLNTGERTFSFPYSDSVDSHAILKDYSPKWANSVFVFYLKAAEFDKPLRVEFLFPQGLTDSKGLSSFANEVASVVYSLSSLHKEYSFPSILIEADLRAGLSEQEINVVFNRLIDKLGPKVRMRRTNRPFG